VFHRLTPDEVEHVSHLAWATLRDIVTRVIYVATDREYQVLQKIVDELKWARLVESLR